MTERARGELPDAEEELLGIERPTPEEEEAAAKAQKERAEFRRLFLVGLMENQMFREWLMEHLVSLGTFRQSFGASPNGSPDPLATQYSMGMKAAGWNLWLIFDDVAPELTSLMRRDAVKAASS